MVGGSQWILNGFDLREWLQSGYGSGFRVGVASEWVWLVGVALLADAS